MKKLTVTQMIVELEKMPQDAMVCLCVNDEGDSVVTKRDLAILTAYTGYMFGEFLDFHEYSEELLGHRIFTNEYKNIELTKKLHKCSKQDFLELHKKLIRESNRS